MSEGIWIVGKDGMLGSELCALLETKGIPYFGTDKECDITDPGAIGHSGGGKRFDWIVNCAAYTAVDKAEDEEQLAHRINAIGPGNLAAYCCEHEATLVHISTDYVFAGDGDRPYSEDDPSNPLGVYGQTKAEGELRVRLACRQHFILRTAWLYGLRGNNFVYTMVRLMRQRSSIGVVADQKGTPTWTRDLAAAIVNIIVTSSKAFGTYHFSNEGEITWFEFAKEILRLGLENGLLDREVVIKPLRTEEYATKARRPAYSVLSKSRIRDVLGCITPDWKTSLEEFMNDLAKRGLHAGS
jgi:dTDP-4-dehydrorhamnose reductase